MLLSAFVPDDPLSQRCHARARLARILRLEDLVQLLQRATLGFHEEEVDDDELEDVEKAEEHVEPVSNLRRKKSKGS